jgi:hypothetical protein
MFRRSESLARLGGVTLLPLFMGLISAIGQCRAQSEFREDAESFSEQVQQWLLDQRRGELETLAERLRRERPRFMTGRPQLLEFYEAHAVIPRESDGKKDPQRSAERVAHLRAWHLGAPTMTTRVALAAGLVQLVWAHRGEGRGVEINPAGAEEMVAALDEADRLLRDVASNPPPGSQDPMLYHVRLRVGILRGAQRSVMRGYWRQAFEIDPRFTSPLDVLCQYSLPRWYGDEGELLELARMVAEIGRAKTGEAAYAIVAMNAIHFGEIEAFSPTGFEWPRVRQGLRDWLTEAPDSPYRWGVLAKFSQLAGDRATAAEAIEHLAGRWHTRVFPRREDFLRVERWARESGPPAPDVIVVDFGPKPLMDVLYVDGGRGFVPGTRERRLEVRSTTDGTIVKEYPLSTGKLELLQVDGEGRFVVFSSPRFTETRVAILDLVSGRESLLGSQPGRTRVLALSRDHRFIVAGNDRGQLKRWENAEVAVAVDWPGDAALQISGLTITSSGETLASIAGTEVTLWELAQRAVRRKWPAHPVRARAVACSPDGTLLATGGFGNEVQLWETATGASRGRFFGGNTSLQSLTFSPDGGRLIGGTMSAEQPQIPGEVIVWDIATQQTLPPLTGHRLGIWKVAVHPDGGQIASASEDGTIRLWRMPD